MRLKPQAAAVALMANGSLLPHQYAIFKIAALRAVYDLIINDDHHQERRPLHLKLYLGATTPKWP